jgi:Ca2+-transporting ATPase
VIAKGDSMLRESHIRPVPDVVRDLETHLHDGLSAAEAMARLDSYGSNELKEQPRPTVWHMFIAQFNNFLVLLLLAASLIAILLGEFVDASAIIAIVIVNAIIGVIQEYKAENALRALKKMAAPTAQVVRDSYTQTIPARELVPGDIVLLEAGNYIPADVRLVESVNLKIDEASLTGESHPVEKDAALVLDKEVPIGDWRNTAFMSTLVTYGRGRGIVTTTGMHTQIGLIAEMIQSYEEEQTPLQQKLAELGKWLGSAALSICGIIFLVGIVRDTQVGLFLAQGPLAYLFTSQKRIVELFMTAVSLAIAAVPEGLPAVVTICLALGMQRMVRRHALIRKLPAVETLGSATAIGSDKTGTLTQNEMMVVRLWVDGKRIIMTGRGYQPSGKFLLQDQPFDPRSDPASELLLRGALLCNDAQLERVEPQDGSRPTFRMVGDPTEGALVVAAAKAGLWKDEQEIAFPRMAEIPFDSERKRMTTIHQIQTQVVGDAPYVAFVKGAPDVLLDLCSGILSGDGVRPLSEAKREEILQANEKMASDALRVLGVAYRSLGAVPQELAPQAVENDLVFVGLLGMIDPPRPEARDAVRTCRRAGIKPVMITGDYKNTAIAIARELAMLQADHRVLAGDELDRLSDEEFAAIVDKVDVYARVSPQHKVRIVEALKAQGHVVAMTGDGVNDAPALKRADIGVAMGITGTDVSKETADMVLTDDNFASIVAAVEEGRVIYSNIRKFVYYLLSCNVGEIMVIFLAQLAGLPLPLRPIQILWVNLLTDGLPALALGIERGDPDIMQRPPRPAKEPIINAPMRWGIALQAVAVTFATLSAFVIGLRWFSGHLESAQTMAFVALNMVELVVAYSFRSERHSALSIGLFSNRSMVWATLSSLLLLFAVIYVPLLDPIFYTTFLGLREWLVLAPLIFVPFVTAELTKLILRRRERPVTAQDG